MLRTVLGSILFSIVYRLTISLTKNILLPTAPLSTTTPALQAEDDTRYAILDIATILHRTVDLSSPPRPITTAPQRVEEHQSTPPTIEETLKPTPAQEKRLNWKKGANKPNHDYKLRSRNRTPRSYKGRAAECLLAQHMFNKASHIYNDNKKDFP